MILKWLKYVSIVLAVAVLGLVACQVEGLHRVNAEWESWEAAGRPLQDLPRQFPDHPASSSARRLDQLARPLGIVLIPDSLRDPALERMRDDEPLKAVLDWTRSLEDATDDRFVPLPDDVSSFLALHHETIVRIVSHLASADGLEWPDDISKGWAHDVPDFQAQWLLQGLLIAHALGNDGTSQPLETRDALEASWRQLQSIVSRAAPVITPEVMAETHNAALRQLKSLGPEWEERLRSYDLAETEARAQAFEVLWFLQPASEYRSLNEAFGDSPPERSLVRLWIDRFLHCGALRAGTVQISEGLRSVHEQVRNGGLCEIDGDALAAQADLPDGVLDALGWVLSGTWWTTITLPPAYERWGLVQHAVLDAELTRRVLDARRTRGESGRWPEAGGRLSEACRGLTWRWDEDGNGVFTIHAEGSIPPGAGEIGEFSFSLSP